MAGVPGKNKIERGFRIWWDDLGTGAGTRRDLTGDLLAGSVSGGGLTFDEVSKHGVSELVKNFLAGHATSEVSAQFHVNDATNRATPVLNGSMPSTTVAGIGTLTLEWGSNGAAPSTGDLCWQGEYLLVQNNLSFSGGDAIHNCKWVPTGATPPSFGTVA